MTIDEVFNELFGVKFYPRWSGHFDVSGKKGQKLVVHLRPQHYGKELCVTLFTRSSFYSLYFYRDGLNSTETLYLRNHKEECPGDENVFDCDLGWTEVHMRSQYSKSRLIQPRVDEFLNAELIPHLPAIKEKMLAVSEENLREAQAAESRKQQLSENQRQKAFDALGL